jgi:erythromycin esterase
MMVKRIVLFLIVCFPGWAKASPPEKKNPELVSYFTSKAVPLNTSADLNAIIEESGSRQLVLLGEATHGTREFYHWRAEITKRLIAEKNFNFIAVEGDWATIYRLNKYVKGLENSMSSALEVLQTFHRWPVWMWSNTDILELAEWLKQHNDSLPAERKTGFYGMDVYGHWDAMDDLLAYSKENLSEKHYEIENLLNCFAGRRKDEWQYARAVADGKPSCETELQQVAEILYRHGENLDSTKEKAHFRAMQNALVIQNAENFYRLVLQNSTDSWNARVDHMWITVNQLLGFYGEDSKGIVWAHNSHVGDSRATSMRFFEQYNIGQLSRENLGEDNVFIAGFGTFRGKVNAGGEWGGRMKIMKIPKAQKRSLDYLLNKVPHPQFFILFNRKDRNHPLLKEPLNHRAIGVVFNPAEDGSYVPTLPAYRYDALLFIRETTGLTQIR